MSERQEDVKFSISDKNIVSNVWKAPELSIRDLCNFPSENSFYWSVPDSPHCMGLGSLLTLRSSGLSRITDQLIMLRDLEGSFRLKLNDSGAPKDVQPRFFGGISFHPSNSLENPWEEFYPAQFTLPKIQLVRNNSQTWLTINQFCGSEKSPERIYENLVSFVDEHSSSAPLRNYDILEDQRYPTKDSWIQLAEDVVSECRNGSMNKVVLSQERRLKMNFPVTMKYVVDRLRDYDHEGFKFILKPSNLDFFTGVSPEKLIVKRGGIVESESLAGTIETSDDENSRASLADELLQDSKNRREHEHVAKFVRDVMSPWVSTLETVPPSVRSLPQIQHILTMFRGKLHDDSHVLEMVRQLHPTPAVGGLPTGMARSFLRKEEPVNRGYYASPVGWFDKDGNGEFCVAIRSALVRGTRLKTYAGAGLIQESKPKKEWQEVQLKYNGLLQALFPSSC